MKKLIALLAVSAMLMGALAGCGDSTSSTTESPAATTEAAGPADACRREPDRNF